MPNPSSRCGLSEIRSAGNKGSESGFRRRIQHENATEGARRRYFEGVAPMRGMLRSNLYEAANVLLTRVAKWSALKTWGMRIAKRRSLSKARVAVARRLAVILHRMWIDGAEVSWSSEATAVAPACAQHRVLAERRGKSSLPGGFGSTGRLPPADDLRASKSCARSLG